MAQKRSLANPFQVRYSYVKDSCPGFRSFERYMDGFRYLLAIGPIGQLEAPGAAAPIPQVAGPAWVLGLSAALCRRLNAGSIATGSFCLTVGKRHGGAGFCCGWRVRLGSRRYHPAHARHGAPGAGRRAERSPWAVPELNTQGPAPTPYTRELSS